MHLKLVMNIYSSDDLIVIAKALQWRRVCGVRAVFSQGAVELSAGSVRSGALIIYKYIYNLSHIKSNDSVRIFDMYVKVFS